MARTASALLEYRARRDFRGTPEPAPAREPAHKKPIFVIQEHHATTLHYDFRIEVDGVLRSWAVTKEPSLDPAVKRLAVRVEDHPLSYAGFKGTIPSGHYGAGEVSIWDRGTFENLDPAHSITDGLNACHLSIALHGQKLHGRFTLVRMRGRGRSKRENWLLIKGRDEFAKRAGASAERSARPVAAATRTTRSKTARVNQHGRPPATIEVTNPNKVLYPDDGFTKADVAAYYRAIAPRLLPFLKDRPVTLERLPDGLGPGKPHFWQKHTPPSYPPWIPRITLDTEWGKPVQYVLVNDRPTLLYLVNQGALTFHPWLSRVGNLDRPDFVLFDLDPGEAPFADVVAVARALHEALKAENRRAVVKTSGKTGIHVLSDCHEGGYDEARNWALEVAERVARSMPDVSTTEIRKVKRNRRVYIDVLQNARGHHAVPPYVIRAVTGAPVSTPLAWRELQPDLDVKRFNLKTVPARLARLKTDPMKALKASAE